MKVKAEKDGQNIFWDRNNLIYFALKEHFNIRIHHQNLKLNYPTEWVRYGTTKITLLKHQ